MIDRGLRGINEGIARVGRRQKTAILVATDAVLVAISFWGAMAIRLGSLTPYPLRTDLTWALLLILPLVGVGVFAGFGLYRIVVRSFGRDAVWRTMQATAVLSLIMTALAYVVPGLFFVPRSTPIIFALLVFFGVLASRAVFREMYNRVLQAGVARRPVLIYGAGRAGTQLAASLGAAPEYDVVGFLDDDRALWKRVVSGHVVHPPVSIDGVISRYGVSDVLLAVPSASEKRRKEIIRFLADRRLRVRTIPSLGELVGGGADVARLRDISIEDLIGRDSVAPMPELFDAVRGKSVLITGAGGSIGSELSRQALAAGARKLVLFEQSEYALYKIEADLRVRHAPGNTEISAVLGSVCDETVLTALLKQHQTDVIYHAAAYKHVPLVEANVIEGLRNNTLGTRSVSRSAVAARVPQAVLVSTDKAVRPPNVMGASKRLAERIFIDGQRQHPGTRFSTVRFGNVMGSSGSVIPLFESQIAAGGPVTVTDARVTRYFMTIPEAAQLVIQAGGLSEGGDVFLLEMGEPVKVLDLARRMIHLAGLEVKDDAHPGGDIEIQFTGLRPGEKLIEELLIDAEAVPTRHPKIFRAVDSGDPSFSIETVLGELESAIAARDESAALAILGRSVEGFRRE